MTTTRPQGASKSTASALSVAVLTADGRGAVAVVRVWGPGALDLASAAFRPGQGRALKQTPVGRLRVGRLGAGLGDEVVAVVIGPDEVEIQCHGGPAAVGMVLEALVAGGATRRPASAWVRRESGSRLQARAMIEAGKAGTVRTAEILLDQAEGALAATLRDLAEADVDALRAGLAELVRWSTLGTRLIGGWRVALAGRPNVGKSRLLNALAGYDRAIVDPTPGTTRDAVWIRAACDGWPVDLADTAGLRATSDGIEAQGVARARAIQEAADLVVVVLDRSEPIGPEDQAVLDQHSGALVVANKADLAAAWDAASHAALLVSAERGDGVEALVAAIAGRLVPEIPPPGAGLAVVASQARWLGVLRDQVESGNEDRVRRSLHRWSGRPDLAGRYVL